MFLNITLETDLIFIIPYMCLRAGVMCHFENIIFCCVFPLINSAREYVMKTRME